MGCCSSRPTGPNSPYPGGATSGSSRAINANPPPLQAQPSPPQSRRSHNRHDGSQPTSPRSPGHRHHERRHQQPLDQHINKPLRRHTWTSKKRWTRSRLDRERIDFFDTRVTGRAEVWQTLRAALEVLWNPEAGADDGSAGLATAQSILDAAEITLPTGDLSNGAYDTLGNYYALPEWVVSDPTNLVDEDDDDHRCGEDVKAIIGVEEADVSGEDETSKARKEKGKAVEDASRLVKVTARLSENATDVTVMVDEAESVRSVERKIMEESGLPGNKRIRLAYMGKILNLQSSLADQGWKTDHIVNALVFPR